MCGICGLTNVSEHRLSADLLKRMCAQIVHRGPDDGGEFVEEGIALAMRRLSIIDVDGGAQPIFNEDRSVVVVQNGEIYNFQELKRRLESLGHHFETRSDTEVIVHLYEEYGLSFVDHLNGMFAIGLWDGHKKRLVLVRDRLGVKPLFYAHVGDSIVFGSEIKCILQHDGVTRERDSQAIYNFFTLGYIPQPRSIYAAIRKLPPAGRLVAEGGQVSIDRYWHVPQEVSEQHSEEEATHRLRELLLDAVRLRMISDVPLGAFLSGGLDSSITVALMAQLASKPIQTFFIDFEDPGYSERSYAQAVADHYGTDHHELIIRPCAADILNDVIYYFDEPFADSSAIPTFLVARLTRDHVTVALAGDGGDESFGGYDRYRRILQRRNLARLRRWAKPLLGVVHRTLPRCAPGRRFVRGLGLPNAEHFVAGTQELETRELLTSDFLTSVDRGILEEVASSQFGPGCSSDPLLPYTHFDLQWYLPDDILTKVDRMSMAHSLEVRAPFLDYRVIELAAQMPADWKIRGTETKAILKSAFSGDLPRKVLEPRKRGFSLPLAEWMRGDLRSTIQDVVHDRELAESGIFCMKEMQRLAHEHLIGVRDRKEQLWRMLVFARWWHAQDSASRETTRRVATPQVSILN